MPVPVPIYPTDPNVQLLVGVIFSESSGKNTGGENADEKLAIGATFINLTISAKLTHIGPKKCYNTSFGDGTMVSAIKLNAQAYGLAAWNRVMTGNALKSAADLAKLTPDDAAHLQLSIAAATALKISLVTVSIPKLGGKAPVNFNKAPNTPPNGRMERIGALGSTTFYGFKTGRECQ